MQRYLIELAHDDSKKSCELAVQVLKSSGSHFLTHADIGCHDGVHMAWLNVEVNNRKEALMIVPPVFRDKAKVVKLQRFSLERIDKFLKPQHK